MGYFIDGSSYVLILTKIGLGYILGDFFTNSSGTDVMIFKIFAEKFSKKWRFWLKTKLNYAKF
jgi:hypothetical protein